MRDEHDGESRFTAELLDDLRRVIARAVVDHEHLEPTVNAALRRE
jgi:hypothetical protein